MSESEGGKRRIWYLLSSGGIGGSERRMVKVACRVAELGIFDEVNLLVSRFNSGLYARDGELSAMLEEAGINVCVKEDYDRTLVSEPAKIRWAKRVHPIFRRTSGPYARLLESFSWRRVLEKLVGEKDVVHCFLGDCPRTGALLHAKAHGNKTIVELTSNRLLHRVARQMEVVLRDARSLGNLHVRAVSKTVFGNFLNYVAKDFFNSRDIDIAPYKGAFFEMKGEPEILPKENVIVFAHRFIEPKNPILFCKVVKRLLDEGRLDGWKVKLRGKGGLEDEIKSTLEPYVENGVVDLGFSFDLGRELAESKIFISIIVTGNFPSQALFEAMLNGNLLVLSRTGETEEHYSHENVQFVDLNEESLTHGLLAAVSDAEGSEFEAKSQSMRDFFEDIQKKKGYLNDVLQIYAT